MYAFLIAFQQVEKTQYQYVISCFCVKNLKIVATIQNRLVPGSVDVFRSQSRNIVIQIPGAVCDFVTMKWDIIVVHSIIGDIETTA